jgi:hypothetical protein
MGAEEQQHQKGSWHKHGHKSEEQLKEELVAKEKSSRVSP